jgi:phosphoglycolate phosphatase
VRRSLGAEHEDRFQEALKTWRAEYEQRLLVKTRAYPGVAELLAVPPDSRGVFTNKPGAFAREILQGLGMAQSFRAVVGGDEAPRKPAPEGLLAVCHALGAAPAETLLIGDSTVDVATARAARVPVCAVTWGLTPREVLASSSPDYLVESAPALAELLARLTG